MPDIPEPWKLTQEDSRVYGQTELHVETLFLKKDVRTSLGLLPGLNRVILKLSWSQQYLRDRVWQYLRDPSVH